MTRKIIISLALVMVVSNVSNRLRAAGDHSQGQPSIQVSDNGIAPVSENTRQLSSLEMERIPAAASNHSAGKDAHGKAARVPHMEELPHIHRYHKERVKKLPVPHTRLWIVAKLLVVVCHLSLLWIAYMHLTH